jgi:hypothetical protein
MRRLTGWPIGIWERVRDYRRFHSEVPRLAVAVLGASPRAAASVRHLLQIRSVVGGRAMKSEPQGGDK